LKEKQLILRDSKANEWKYYIFFNMQFITEKE
jgi:hypothetical protein